MALDDYYFSDSRLVLVPIEHLHPAGVSREFAAAAAARRGWPPARVALLDAAVGHYWSRTVELARRTRTWAPPRLRHIAVLRDPLAIHPYAQLLNVSAWTLYECDLDPQRSHPELAAYLLAHGDRMARTGEVTMAALHNAAWWFERSDAECAAFSAAAARSTRPDAAALQALAAALPWIRQLCHSTLRPASAGGHRAIPGSELLVPTARQAAPQHLVDRWTAAARDAIDAYARVWCAPDLPAVADLTDWLVAAAPPLLITGAGGRTLWDPDRPDVLASLRAELGPAAGAAVRDVHADLAVLDRHTRRFLASLADPGALPSVALASEQQGYTYLHHDRRLLAYNIDEPGIDRRHGPALPFARCMLGARAVHEWAHLCGEAGWVPLAVPVAELERRVAALAAQLDAAVANAPPAVRRSTAADLAALAEAAAAPAGLALARLLLLRMPDFQSNLLAVRYLDEAERETYVRHNVRPLRDAFPPAGLWRQLTRYLYEFQYLRFSAVTDRRAFFRHSTWCDADFIAGGVLAGEAFDRLTAAAAVICDAYAVDESKFVALPVEVVTEHRRA